MEIVCWLHVYAVACMHAYTQVCVYMWARAHTHRVGEGEGGRQADRDREISFF